MVLILKRRIVASAITGSLLAGSILGVTSAAERHVARPAAKSAQPNAAAHGNQQVLIEGGSASALFLGNIADIVGVPIADGTTGFYRDEASELDIPATPATNPQFLYAAVGAGAAQLDFVNQKSGFSGKTTAVPPIATDAYDTYSNVSPYGFTPWSGTTTSTFASDSLTFAGGDAPIPLGPAEGSAYVPSGFTIYGQSLAAYNGGGDTTGAGFNAARGPAIVEPYVGTAISVIYNTTGLTIPSGGLNLTQDDVCGIFTGVYTNWNQTSANPGNAAITIVHRSDGSGNTFLFTYDLSQMCSSANPFKGAGAPNPSEYWGNPSNTSTQGVGTDSNNFLAGNVIPTDGTAPEVVWPASSVGANKLPGELAAVNSTTGAVGYVSPSYTPGSAIAEANVENYTGAFEPANATTVSASLASTTTSDKNPPGFPYDNKTSTLYFPFPTASGGAPIVGYSYVYLYECTNARDKDAVSGMKKFLQYETSSSTSATAAAVAAYWNLNGLGASELKALNAAAGGLKNAAVTKPTLYYSPVDGSKKEYTCTT